MPRDVPFTRVNSSEGSIESSFKQAACLNCRRLKPRKHARVAHTTNFLMFLLILIGTRATRNSSERRRPFCSRGRLEPQWKPRDSETRVLYFNEPCTRRQAHSAEQKKLTVAVLYCDNKDLLRAQLRTWDALSDKLKNLVAFMIVDDGSSVSAASIVRSQMIDIHLDVIRIIDELEWNIGGGRNLAIHAAETEVIFLSDVDLLLDERLVESLIRLSVDAESSYDKTHELQVFVNFPRIRPDKSYKPHPAAMLISKTAYWKVGGCDEDFVGHYGSTDPHFHWRMERTVGVVKYKVHERFPSLVPLEELQSTGRTGKLLDRNTTVNHELFEYKKEHGSWSNLYLRFDWYVDLSIQRDAGEANLPRHRR